MDLKELSPLVLAMDTDRLEEGRSLARNLKPWVDVVKIGLLMFSREGIAAVEAMRGEGFEVFLDIKLMDIPNTVASACRALCDLGPLMFTVHSMGGQEMMRAAAAAVGEYCPASGSRKPLVIGVTLLTSFDSLALRKVGVSDPVDDYVLRLAKLAQESGLDGLVASPLETVRVRRLVGPDMVIVTPGIRLAEREFDDQKRVATPSEAVKAGSDFLVVGRPLVSADDPEAVAEEIIRQVKG